MGLEVNSMAVPRKARQAVGGIAKLKHDDGRQMTVRDERNDTSTGLCGCDRSQVESGL